MLMIFYPISHSFYSIIIIIEDREPHRGTVRGTATKLVRCIDKRCKFVWYGTQREPYRTKTGTVRIAVRFAVLNNKRIMVSILVRYGSR